MVLHLDLHLVLNIEAKVEELHLVLHLDMLLVLNIEAGGGGVAPGELSASHALPRSTAPSHQKYPS